MPDRYAGHSATFLVDSELVEFRYGDEIPKALPKAVRDALREQDAFIKEEDTGAAPPVTVVESTTTLFDAGDATDEQIDAWLALPGTTVPVVLAAAGEDTTLANRLLEAERRISGGKPRRGVEDGLVVIGRPA